MFDVAIWGTVGEWFAAAGSIFAAVVALWIARQHTSEQLTVTDVWDKGEHPADEQKMLSFVALAQNTGGIPLTLLTSYWQFGTTRRTLINEGAVGELKVGGTAVFYMTVREVADVISQTPAPKLIQWATRGQRTTVPLSKDYLVGWKARFLPTLTIEIHSTKQIVVHKLELWKVANLLKKDGRMEEAKKK